MDPRILEHLHRIQQQQTLARASLFNGAQMIAPGGLNNERGGLPQHGGASDLPRGRTPGFHGGGGFSDLNSFANKLTPSLRKEAMKDVSDLAGAESSSTVSSPAPSLAPTVVRSPAPASSSGATSSSSASSKKAPTLPAPVHPSGVVRQLTQTTGGLASPPSAPSQPASMTPLPPSPPPKKNPKEPLSQSSMTPEPAERAKPEGLLSPKKDAFLQKFPASSDIRQYGAIRMDLTKPKVSTTLVFDDSGKLASFYRTLDNIHVQLNVPRGSAEETKLDRKAPGKMVQKAGYIFLWVDKATFDAVEKKYSGDSALPTPYSRATQPVVGTRKKTKEPVVPKPPEFKDENDD